MGIAPTTPKNQNVLERRRLERDLSRRNFLKLGGLCVGGLTLADLLRLEARGQAPRRASSKAVIIVWLEGGPSHIDMYDLKPEAPDEYRGPFRPIATRLSGVHLSSASGC